jgi:hypothetical protein
LLNYRLERTNATVLVLGSMGHLYCLTVQARFSVGAFKEMVWEQERLHRDARQDAKEGFKVHTFSKVSTTLALDSEYARALTFQN